MKVHRIMDACRAQAEMEESDRARAKFIRDMTGANWTDSLNYRFCIDSSRVGSGASVGMIMNLIR